MIRIEDGIPETLLNELHIIDRVLCEQLVRIPMLIPLSIVWLCMRGDRPAQQWGAVWMRPGTDASGAGSRYRWQLAELVQAGARSYGGERDGGGPPGHGGRLPERGERGTLLFLRGRARRWAETLV